jgi:hypothetical protein
MSIVENLYQVTGLETIRLNPEQLDYFIYRINQAWNDISLKLREKLVGFLRFIGCKTFDTKIFERVRQNLCFNICLIKTQIK